MKSFFPHSVIVSGAFLAFFTTFQSFAAQSESVQQSALFVPWTAVENALLKTVSDRSGQLLDVKLENITLQAQDIPVTVSQIQIDVTGQVRLSDVKDQWKADPLGIKIAVGGFEISQVVERWVSGALVRVHLKAQCSPFEIKLAQGRATMGLQWNSQGRDLHAEVQNLELNWPEHAWALGEIKCDGPEGFADVISMELKKQLAEPQVWVARIKEELQVRLNEKLSEGLKVWQNPRAVPSGTAGNVYIHFSETEVLEGKGILFKGFLSSQDNQNELKDLKPLDALSLVNKINTTVPLLLVPGDEVARLSSEIGSKSSVQYDLKEISGFARVLRSRFLQFFVWPDLMNFPKSSLFPSVSKFSKPPVVKYSNHVYLVQGNVQTQVNSQRNGRAFTYLDVSTNVAGHVVAEIKNESIHLSWKKRSMKTGAQMNGNYRKMFNPRTYLPLGTVNEAMEESAMLKSLEVRIPRIQITDGLEFGAYKIHRVVPEVQVIELRLK